MNTEQSDWRDDGEAHALIEAIRPPRRSPTRRWTVYEHDNGPLGVLREVYPGSPAPGDREAIEVMPVTEAKMMVENARTAGIHSGRAGGLD